MHLINLSPSCQAEEIIVPLRIPGGPQGPCSSGPWLHCIIMLIMHLDILTKLAVAMLIVLNGSACHNGSGAQCLGHSLLVGKSILLEHCPPDHLNNHIVENSSSRFFQISCSQGILNSSRLSCYLLLRLLVYMYLSQLMRTFTNYLKCIVISS